MRPPALHPRLWAHLAGFVPRVCTVQHHVDTRDAFGQPIAAWSNVTGLNELQCAFGNRRVGTVNRDNSLVSAQQQVVLIPGDYAIATDMRVVFDDGGVFSITDVSHDQLYGLTELTVRAVV